MAQLILNITSELPEGVDAESLHRVIAALGKRTDLDIPHGAINLKLVDDAEITALNKEYSGNAYPTDVLSFSYIENGHHPIDAELGDVAISLETAARQAEAAGTTLEDELALLLLHGALHVIGLDHQTTDEQGRINKLQAEIMRAAGLEYRDFNWHE